MKKFIDKKLFTLGEGENRLSLFALTFPLFFESISGHLIGMVQTIMATRYHGGMFVIPISVASSVVSLFGMVLAIITAGLSILLSIEIGRKHQENCKKIVGVSLWMSVILAVILSIVQCVLAKPLLVFMGMDKPDYAPYLSYAITYLRIRVFAMIIQIVGNVLITSLRCYGHTAQGFVCSLCLNIVSAAGTAIIVYVLKVPQEHGAMALGLVPMIAALVYVLIAFAFFIHKKIGACLHWSGEWLKKIFSIGAPASVSSISYNISQTVAAMICLSLTPSAYLAKNYLSQVVYFVYIFGYAIGQANAIIIGRLCGMNELEQADKMHRQNLRIVLLCNALLSLITIALGKKLLVWFYAADEEVAAYATVIFIIDLFVEIGRGMNHLGQFGLNAAGDVRFTTIVSILSCWGCSIGLSALFVIVFGWDLYGMWIAFAIDELFRGILYLVRWKKQSWRKHLMK
ncbi:MAG: hypothetical protein IJV80_00340 [Clostridia bacterium]|nr:hypothetical protein [Clostridia bacterium]